MTFPIPPGRGRLLAALARALGLPADARPLVPLLAIAGVGVALAGGYAYAAGWLTPQRLSASRIIDTFSDNFGAHPGMRRNHAKGVCVGGYFDGNGNAARYSQAAVFGVARTPVIGRFAIPGGNPSINDAASPVRSMALLFQLPQGEQWRTAMNSTPVFIANTPQGFYDNLLASRPDPLTHKPDPAKLQAWFDLHPESLAFRQWVKAHPPSSGLGNASYYSINAFSLVDHAGAQRYARWAMVPELPYAPVDAQAAAGRADFLAEDLQERLGAGPLRWHLILTLAAPGDASNDATRAWPADRQMVDAGTLTLERAESQDDGACRDVNFDPLILPRGIQPSGDPLLAARSGAYSRSFNLRTHEQAALGHGYGNTLGGAQ